MKNTETVVKKTRTRRSSKWTSEEVAILRKAVRAGRTYKQIRRDVFPQRTVEAIQTKASRLGLSIGRGKRMSEMVTYHVSVKRPTAEALNDLIARFDVSRARLFEAFVQLTSLFESKMDQLLAEDLYGDRGLPFLPQTQRVRSSCPLLREYPLGEPFARLVLQGST